jgi:cephalosporin hydroxylase
MPPADSDDDEFEGRNAEQIERLGDDVALKQRALRLMHDAERYQYSYHFRWLGCPIIQYPQDLLALQEIVWQVQPERIVETGLARGGSAVFFASLLHLIGGDGKVVSVDVDVRPHNRRAIELHPMRDRIVLVEGSSIAPSTVDRVTALCRGRRTLVVLDSDHTHAHVLQELDHYSPLVGKGSYLVVLDTVVADFPSDFFPNRPWGPADNPKTAVHAFLARNPRFAIDAALERKLLLTVAPDGYLRCIAD